jgi:hypothetical protein
MAKSKSKTTNVDTYAAEGETEVAPRPNATSPTSAKLAEVIDLHVETFSADELAILNAAVVELQAYEASLVVDPDVSTEPPVNRDVPYASQAGSVINCTMGNWDGEPTVYTYQWKIDGTDVPGDGMDLPIAEGDIGRVATCVVTAENAAGSTMAPPSNPVTIA